MTKTMKNMTRTMKSMTRTMKNMTRIMKSMTRTMTMMIDVHRWLPDEDLPSGPIPVCCRLS